MRQPFINAIGKVTIDSLGKRLAAGVLLSASLLPAAASAAPNIEVANYDLKTTRAVVELKTDLEMNHSLRDAVDGGAVVAFVTELKIMNERWYGDRLLHHYQWTGRVRRVQYGLGYEYQPFGATQWHEAVSVNEALALIDTLTLEITEAGLISQMRSFDTYLSYRIEVDLDNLPNPLKVDLLTSAEWKFSSGWLQTRN